MSASKWIGVICSVLLASITLVFAQPLQQEMSMYPKAIYGGGSISVVYDEIDADSDKVLSVTIPTSQGDIVITTNYTGSTFTGFSAILNGTSDTFTFSLSDSGSGAWSFTANYGSAGEIQGIFNNTTGALQLTSSTISDCDAVTNNSLFIAMFEARSVTRVVAESINTTTRGRLQLWHALSMLDSVVDVIALSDCNPETPYQLTYFHCTAMQTPEECFTCCYESNAMGAAVCTGIAFWGVTAGPGVLCFLGIVAGEYNCQNNCNNAGGGAPDSTCGNWPFTNSGKCKDICIDGAIIAGNCALPMICCHENGTPY